MKITVLNGSPRKQNTAVVEFIFAPASDEGFVSTVSIMAASIQPIA